VGSAETQCGRMTGDVRVWEASDALHCCFWPLRVLGDVEDVLQFRNGLARP
jgi:hypothetical protein